MNPKDADLTASSVDPDQTDCSGAVWSGSTLFAKTCLSKNLGSLQYLMKLLVTLNISYVTPTVKGD